MCMQYRKDKKGNSLSMLGYGCMRFTSRNGKIDLDAIDLRRVPFSRKNSGGISDICDVYVDIVSGLKRLGF